MNKKKFGIIGAGTVGVISALKIIEKLYKYNKMEESEIYLIHDPNLPKISVGETTTYKLLNSLQIVFGVNKAYEILQKCNFTKKHNVNFQWKDGLGYNFSIPHTDKDVNFDSLQLSKTLIKSFKGNFENFNLIEKNVRKINNSKVFFDDFDLHFDYIIDSSGWPSKKQLENDYILPEIETVNSGHIFQLNDIKNEKQNYITSHYHDNGWVFEIPLQNKKTYGFLYNDKYISKENALKNFKKMFNFIDVENTKHIKWKFYYRKKCLGDNILHMGNNLYFFEPSGALPLHFFMTFIGDTIDTILKYGYNSFNEIQEQINNEFERQIKEMYSLVLLNYSGKMKKNTKFWNKMNVQVIEHLKKCDNFQNYINKCINDGEIVGYWKHDGSLMSEYINNFGIELLELKRRD